MSTPAAQPDTAGSSGSMPPFPGAAADSERRVQPRHFHAGRNPSSAAVAASSSGDSDAAESNCPPPAARLYRHALESIFRFLDQRELVTALQVSKDWLAAAKSMASLQLIVARPSVPLRVVADSVMGRHVSQLGSADSPVALTADSLFILTRHTAHLRALFGKMTSLSAHDPLIFPPGLRELHLVIIDNPAAANINAALRTISRLPVLEIFAIYLSDFDQQLSFAPLASLPQLRAFVIHHWQVDGISAQAADLSDAQVAELRGLPLLRRLDLRPMSASLLHRLLAQPHELQWKKIALPETLNDEVAALLPQLPSLTALDDPNAAVTCSRFNFLRGLPNLTSVQVHLMDEEAIVAGRFESLVAGLQCCSMVTTLELTSRELTAAHLNELLPRLPRLHTLSLGFADITTLAFLAQPPMTQQLTRFELIGCERLLLTELIHVHALRGLRGLSVVRSFDAPMDALCQSLHTPPSPLMPQLKAFIYKQP